MNSIKHAMLLGSASASVSASTTFHGHSASVFKPATVIGSIPLSMPNRDNIIMPKQSNSSQNDFYGQLPHELVDMIESEEQSRTDGANIETNISYVASYDGSYCSPKSSRSLESWEESFTSLHECCELRFSWDMDGCLNNELPEELVELIVSAVAEHRTEVTSADMYFAAYENGSCLPKDASLFESWEESFSTLRECCEMSFSWNVEACLGR